MSKNSTVKTSDGKLLKKAISLEGFATLGAFILFFAIAGHKMGLANSISTLLETAYDLLMNTVFKIMAIAVVAGALAGLMTEFGVISMANKALAPLMKPIYGLPGASSISVFTTYLSDNPAILTLADDNRFKRYFKKYQLPALTNIGTAFGMGLIVTVFMIKIQSNENIPLAVLIGNLSAVIGSIVSVRIMLHFTKRAYGTEAECLESAEPLNYDILQYREIKEGGVAQRVMNSLLEGGKSGVEVGLSIIPGVLIICSIVMILTFGPSESGAYTGAAYEGIAFLPWLGDKLGFILKTLFGFSSPECVSVPITALGSAGAAIGVIPGLVQRGAAHARDIAVFTAMCMCWSGYLSTHVAMMDSLNYREMTGKAIIAHTIGGACAGISANLIFKLIEML